MNAPIRHRANRATPAQLKELRLLRVAVLHPDDTDGRQLTQQLQRIGCQVQAFWPPVPALPEGIDVVFLAVQPEISQMEFDWTKAENPPTCIAVVNYENPTIVDTVLRLGAKAVLPSPVRSFGLLSALVIARTVNRNPGAGAAHPQAGSQAERRALHCRGEEHPDAHAQCDRAAGL